MTGEPVDTLSETSQRPVATSRERRRESVSGARRPRRVSDEQIPGSTWATSLALLLGDVGGLLLVAGLVYAATGWMSLAEVGGLDPSLALMLGAVLGSFWVAGLYRREFIHPALELRRMTVVVAVTGGAATLTTALLSGFSGHFVLFCVSTAIGAVVLPAARVFVRVLCSQMSWWGFPAVIVSSGDSGDDLLRTLRRWPELGLQPAAVLSDSESNEQSEAPIRGHYEQAPHLARDCDIPYAIVTAPDSTQKERSKRLLRYTKFFNRVFVLPHASPSVALWKTGRGGEGLRGYGVQNPRTRPSDQWLKRVMDLVGASLALVALLPLLVFIAVLIRLDSPGPVFFRQERMGREGRIFTVFKFRTMYEDADQKLKEVLASDPERRREYDRYHKLSDDPRVTPVGRFLRRYSLDELPQLFNVLRGEMSLVGPRAYLASELPDMQRLEETVLQATPGMTGLWQVSGRNNLSFDERVRLDVHYTQNWSLWLDLYLLIRTVPVLVTGEGAS